MLQQRFSQSELYYSCLLFQEKKAREKLLDNPLKLADFKKELEDKRKKKEEKKALKAEKKAAKKAKKSHKVCTRQAYGHGLECIPMYFFPYSGMER
jgi:hypothetical protein